MISSPCDFCSIKPKIFMQPEKKVVVVRTMAKPMDTTDWRFNSLNILPKKYMPRMTPTPQKIAKKSTYSTLTEPKTIRRQVEAAEENITMYILVLAATLGATPRPI